jgi:myosin heavy subunit
MGAGDFLNNVVGAAQKDAQDGLKKASDAAASGEKTAQQEAQKAEQAASAAEKKAQQDVAQAQQQLAQAEQKAKQEVQQAEQQVQQAEQKLAAAEKQAQQLEKSAENAANQAEQQAQKELQQAQQQLANAEKQAQQAVADAQKKLTDEQAKAKQALSQAQQQAAQLTQQLESKVQQTVQQLKNEDQALQQQAQQAIQGVQQPGAKTLMQQVSDTIKGGVAQAAATAIATFAKLQQTFSSPDPLDATETPCQNKSVYSVAMAIQQGQQLAQQAQEQGLGNTPPVQALQQLTQASQMALMADDVYAAGANKPPVNIPGFQRVSDDGLKEMGLSPSMFSNAEQDFRAQLYKANSLPGQAEQYVLAFRGTVQDSAANWNNNFRNALGLESEAYNQAIALAARAQRAAQLQGASLMTTGHSLGGGLAQAASSYLSSVGAPMAGTIFNAAGYNPASTPQFPSQSTVDSLTNYHVAGEAVTALQNKLGLTPASAKQVQLPGVPNASAAQLHSMDSVEKGLASESKQACSTVTGMLGKP